MKISNRRNRFALAVVLVLVALALVAQAPTKSQPAAKKLPGNQPRCTIPFVQVNVNCNGPVVYKPSTHTGDAVEVNFHATDACKLTNFTGDDIFQAKEIPLDKGDNCTAIYQTGTAHFCVDGQTCPPTKLQKKPGSKKSLGSDPNEIIVP